MKRITRAGSVHLQDIFGFLSESFAGRAEFNNNGAVEPRDRFDFLAAFFSECQ
jgi:hypothetical protein